MYAVLLVLALLATAQSGPAQTMPSSTTMTPGNSGNSGMQGANTMPMNATGMSNSNSMGPARTSNSTVMPGN